MTNPSVKIDNEKFPAESVAEHHAKEWVRCIRSAGGDENVAQQAITLAALNGLFDIHRDPAAQELLASLKALHHRLVKEGIRFGPLIADAEAAIAKAEAR